MKYNKTATMKYMFVSRCIMLVILCIGIIGFSMDVRAEDAINIKGISHVKYSDFASMKEKVVDTSLTYEQAKAYAEAYGLNKAKTDIIYALGKDGYYSILEYDDSGNPRSQSTNEYGLTNKSLNAIYFDSSYYIYISHVHQWNYKAEGSTITANCTVNDCPLDGESVSISFAAKDPYSSSGTNGWCYQDEVQFTVSDGQEWCQVFKLSTTPQIYYKGENYPESTTMPTEEGSYEAYLKAGTVKAVYDFVIGHDFSNGATICRVCNKCKSLSATNQHNYSVRGICEDCNLPVTVDENGMDWQGVKYEYDETNMTAKVIKDTSYATIPNWKIIMPGKVTTKNDVECIVTTIEREAFRDCENLVEIKMPDSITTIGSRAFDSCKNLTKVTIPEGVTTIPSQCFEDCSSLKDVIIPNGVTNIESAAFYGTAIENMELPNSVTKIGNDVFSECNSLSTIKVGCGSVLNEKDDAFWKETKANDSVSISRVPHSITNRLCTSCGLCESFVNKGAHVYEGEKYNCSIQGKHYRKCRDCMAEEIPVVHSYQWNYNSQQHWKICVCGDKKDVSPHTYTNGECQCGYIKPVPATPVVGKSYFSKSKITVLAGDMVKCGFVNKSGKTVTYKSSNSKLATVNSTGVIKGIQKGNVKITATVNGQTYTLHVVVVKPSISGKSVVKKGKKTTLKMKYSISSVKWTSSNKKIATVDKNGVVKGVKKGKVVITATYNKKKYKKVVKVN